MNGAYSIVLITPDTSGFQSRLPHLNHFVETHTLDDIWDHLRHDLPDAIITLSDDNAHCQFFSALHNTYSMNQRPAIILCADTIPDSRCMSLVDAVLPQLDHPLTAFQIRQTIEYKRQITELQLERNALQAANRDLKRKQAARSRSVDELEVLKNTIVRNVTHELSTPLLQVKAAVALLAEDARNNSLVEYALRSTARLEAVVKNITQLAASLDDMHMSPLIVRECIDSALRDLRRTWEVKEHIARIKVCIDDNLPLASGDRQGITTVLQQLIDNALKFSKDTVEVSAQLKNDEILISVKDYGIGIAPDQQEVIFETFYQIDSSSRRHYGGTGVGLAIVRLILDRHGAEIRVTSQPGKGSIFSFDLPVAQLDSH